jgi:hypothetical protein
MQEGYPTSYIEEIDKIKKYEQFYRILLSRYQLCLSCVYRICGVLAPKLYSDKENNMKVMTEVLQIGQ